MKKEVEIQVIIKNPEKAEEKLNKTGKYIKTRKQIDKYFIPPEENFFEKNPPIEYLRIRFEKDGNHLNYSFLNFDKNGDLISTDEYETLIREPKVVEEILKKIRLIQVVTVKKIRKYFDCGNFEITIDQVEGLGNFMEIEAKNLLGTPLETKKKCKKFLKELEIEYEIKKEMGYPRMLYKKLHCKK